VGATLKSFKIFVKKWLAVNLTPLVNKDFTVEAWLNDTDYPLWRKDELRREWENKKGRTPSKYVSVGERQGDFINKAFVKCETYPCYKFPRSINSRTDLFKCYTGPVFKRIEEEVFKHPSFIKHIPVKDRPQYIFDKMAGHNRYYVTDYTSFEASFVPEIMKACEMQLYKHMLVNNPKAYRVIKEALTGENISKFRHYSTLVPGVRMSGDMCTSLGNGFTNLMLFTFFAERNGGRAHGIVEGDDGLIASTVPITKADFEELGFIIKMEEHASLYDTSFCGMNLSSELTSMVDPIKTLLNFGWSHSPLAQGGAKLRRSLMKAKALSLLYENPRCPVVTILGLKALELAGNVKPRFHGDVWERQIEKESVEFKEHTHNEINKGISEQIRADFAIRYGISIPLQKEWEKIICSSKCGFVCYTGLLDLVHSDTLDYFRKYVMHNWMVESAPVLGHYDTSYKLIPHKTKRLRKAGWMGAIRMPK